MKRSTKIMLLGFAAIIYLVGVSLLAGISIGVKRGMEAEAAPASHQVR